ncbi:efflux RND transporter periplasmic adaptor subunit [Halobacteriovorax sp. CON-3]|uniref:efflux RND transporter periplasmic adaptor subunit n=1 Tax=Halobacteriovorax sp. CON-3 TaxID=3157710 RepID=UPI003718D2E2
MSNSFTLLLILFIFSILTSCQKDRVSFSPPTVEVYLVKPETVSLYNNFVGQVYGEKDIIIRARIEGYIRSLRFREGMFVEKDQLLYEIESDSYQAAVQEQMGRVAKAQSQVVKTRNDLRRIRPLAQQNAVARSDLDAAIASYNAAKSALKAEEANLESVKVRLGYTKVYSPIKGVIGKTRFKVGDLVGSNPNNSDLNTVSSLENVRVEFFISENTYLDVIHLRRDKASAQSTRNIELTLILANGVEYPHKGKIDFLDRNVDPSTGTILIQSTFPNPEGILRPGLFATVRAKVATSDEAILVPQRCVTELQGIYQVAVVDKKNKVQIKNVTVGRKINGFWIIVNGLDEGDTIVYEGLQKVRDGMLVAPMQASVKFKQN